MVGKNRVDIENLSENPDVASEKTWANAELRYPFADKSTVTLGGNVVTGQQIVQGIGRLQQTTLEQVTETQIYGSLTTPVGIRLATWWNHMDAPDAGLSSVTPGGIDVPA